MTRSMWVFLCLFVLDLSSFAEFRTWKSKEGQPVEAEYKGVDGDKVILLREDGKEFLIRTSMLCEEDQAYIEENLSAISQDAPYAAEDTLFISKSDAKEIAEKYAEAIKDNNLEALKKLIWNSEDPERAWDPLRCLRSDISVSVEDVTNVRIKYLHKKPYGYEVKTQVVTKDDGVVHECFVYVQMLRGGEIKYDTLGLPHPYEELCDLVKSEFMTDYNTWNHSEHKRLILKLGVPSFDYEKADSTSDIKRVMKKMRSWLKDEGEEWDVTAPKVPCQEDVFEYWVKALKSY